ncbi:MAG: endonuclease MutS2, partial [Selenomonadales bacterium]|nr:endonuclease MutS2 [Selenomonadales bacterium]
DIRSSVTRAGLGSVLMPDEFLAIRSTLYAARRLKRFFGETALDLPRLRELALGITMFQKIEDKIEGAISEQGAVRDDASVELMRIRRDLKSFQGQIKDRLEGILKHPDYQKFFQENLVTMRGDRYVIPVKQAYRHAFPGIVHDQSASGATVFIEPMAIVKINNDIKQLQLSEKQEVERILRVLSQLIGAESELIRETCEAMAELDFIVARALYGEAHQAVRPVISKERCISLRKARHPLIDRTKVVPIDIVMKPNTKALLITGPNTGGKTVTMKTLGLFALMMQSGLFLPAAEGSELPIFDSVYADIGDEQSIEQSLSTFSAHMTHLVDILRQAKPNDLLLLDEVGAGTDPEEGAALAMAILEHILSCGAKTVATTHYSQLKLFAYEHPEIENASVEFDTKTLRPTYRLLIGVPGSSNAFAISKRLGLSDDIISKAQEFLEEEHIRLESVLSDLEAEKRAYTERSEEAYRLQQESIKMKRRASDERRELKAEQKRILQKAQEEAAAIIQEARRQSEMVIRELKEQFKQTNEAKRQASIQSARTSLQRARDNVGSLDRYEEKGGMQKEEAKVGQTVYVASLRQKGTIESIKGDNAIVQCGFL